jgi:hypothetical protein
MASQLYQHISIPEEDERKGNMALSIGVWKGSRISVGDHCIEVKGFCPTNLIVIAVDGGENIIISDLMATEIVPNVRVFSGVGKDGVGRRLAFEAPREIAIRRLS